MIESTKKKLLQEQLDHSLSQLGFKRLIFAIILFLALGLGPINDLLFSNTIYVVWINLLFWLLLIIMMILKFDDEKRTAVQGLPLYFFIVFFIVPVLKRLSFLSEYHEPLRWMQSMCLTLIIPSFIVTRWKEFFKR